MPCVSCRLGATIISSLLPAGYELLTAEAGGPARTFQRSFGKGSSSAVWMVRLSVLVHTDTGMVPPSSVCTGDPTGIQESYPAAWEPCHDSPVPCRSVLGMVCKE